MTDAVRRPNDSLTRRLFIGAAVWSLAVLAGGAFALSAVYRAQTLAVLDDELQDTLIQLARALEVGPNGAISAKPEELPNDPDYATQLAGKYWAIVGLTPSGGFEPEDIRPPSLWDEPPPVPQGMAVSLMAAPGVAQYGEVVGPGVDETLRVAAQTIIVENRDQPVLLVAANDRGALDQSANRFLLLLVIALGLLAAGLLAAMWGSLRLALRPLRAIEADVADVREGRKTKLSDDYPSEVRPLSEELNKLLDHNRSVVERAQTHVGNLAHALKTPIAVLMNEANGDAPLDDVVRRQARAMNENVQHYLKRAQAAARAEAIGARADVGPVLDDLTRLLNRLFQDKGVDISTRGGAGAVFRGERQDLEEMLGNLMENACKWAAGRVEVSVAEEPGWIVIDIDDDGPGLSAEERETATKRGVRLDETEPGTGLGLSIVTELAEMHSGTFELSDSPLGGLRARLRLKKA
ncbi:MAG: sensor histidine kinase [Pseudomonadota bacterium]